MRLPTGRAGSVALAALLAVALATRLAIERPTLIAERQYRSALIARSLYFDRDPSVPEWRQQVAAAAVAGEDVLEPPIFEHVVSRAYRILGRESLRIPGLLSTLLWLAGGLLMFGVALRFTEPPIAWLAAAYYLFLPLGIEVSLLFLPEPLMMTLYLAALLLLLRWSERPTGRRLLIAAIVSGLAILVKPLCLFALIGAFCGLWISAAPESRPRSYGQAAAFLLLALAIGMTYYVYGMVFSDLLAEKAGKTFFPELLFTAGFWKDWPATAVGALGLVPLILALFGFQGLRPDAPRPLLAGLFAGFGVFMIVFAYHVRFAGYYYLQLVPAIPLAATPVFQSLSAYVERTFRPKASWPVLLLAAVGCWWAVWSEVGIRQADRPAIERADVAREIGNLVDHSTRVVFVSSYYGTPLSYLGEMAGEYWPGPSTAGRPSTERVPDILGRFASVGFDPEYLVVTDFDRLRHHYGDLDAFVSAECDLVAATREYRIHHLRDCLHQGSPAASAAPGSEISSPSRSVSRKREA